MLGLRVNDEILMCAGVNFHNPDGEGKGITHIEAVKTIQKAAGETIVVQSKWLRS